MKAVGIGFAVLAGIVLLMVVGRALAFTGEALEVAQEEFGPRALLDKYEWFKTTAAQLDAKVATIKLQRSRVEQVVADYPDPQQRPRDVRSDMTLWRQEATGTIASYNNLVAEYNAQHAKFNWRFADVGQLPKGATEVVPRDYREYQTSF